MRYPKKFVSAVKAANPNNRRLNRALERGSESVGRILKDISHQRIELTEIVLRFKQGRERELCEKAKRALACGALHSQWRDLRYPPVPVSE